MFADRREAGLRLAQALERAGVADDAIVLGIPRGGVIVAAEVAHVLGLPLDIVVASKLGAPGDPEYAVGAVDADGEVSFARPGAPDALLIGEAAIRGAEVRRQLGAYRVGREPLHLDGRDVIVADDGIATGLTMQQAVAYLERHGARSVTVAAPVASPDAAVRLRAAGITVVSVYEPEDFTAVGSFYRDFNQTSDDEVVHALQEAAREDPPTASASAPR